jgi:hypothetical protein
MREFYYSCMSHGVEKVIFSDIIVRKGRRDIEEKLLLVNSLLKDICDRDWVVNACLIENTNIYRSDLFTDGLHLVEGGSIKLANNILNCVNGI